MGPQGIGGPGRLPRPPALRAGPDHRRARSRHAYTHILGLPSSLCLQAHHGARVVALPHLKPEGLLPLESRAGDYCSELNDCEDSSESEGGRDGAKKRGGGDRVCVCVCYNGNMLGIERGPMGLRILVLHAHAFVGRRVGAGPPITSPWKKHKRWERHVGQDAV